MNTSNQNHQQHKTTGELQTVVLDPEFTAETDEMDPAFSNDQHPPLDPEEEISDEDEFDEEESDEEFPTEEDLEDDFDTDPDLDEDDEFDDDEEFEK